MEILVVDSNEKLQTICQQFSKSSYLIIDTEFIRQTTYYPVLALLQVCDGKTIAIIDPLSISDLKPLIELCFEPQIEKVLHSARQDLEIIFHLCGKLPTPVFDTQIAAALLGYGSQIGYAALVKSYLGVEIDKSQTRTDWLKRPLSQKQLEYAANDVRYLDQIYQLQKQQLIEMKRLDWLKNDFKHLTEQSTYLPDKKNLWKKIRGHQRLKPEQLVILQYLTAWREDIAIIKDITRKKVIHDDLLLEIAIQKPTSLEQLKAFPCLSTHIVQRYGKALVEQVNKALDSPREHWPELSKKQALTPLQDALTDCLMAINHLCASHNKISPNCLTNRKELEKLILGKRDLNILSGWRYELAGKQLLDFLDGKHTLAVKHKELSLL